MFLLSFLFSLMSVLLSVAFFTLMERKFMGLMHYRKGPNKVILWGISQPISDAIKLLTKEVSKMTSYKMMLFFSGPCVMMIIMMILWGSYEYNFFTLYSPIKIMIIIAVMSLTAYGFILMSWGSNSKYSIIGGHRAIAQIISYEVCLALFMFFVIFSVKSFSMNLMSLATENMWMLNMSLPLFFSWVILCMAESNRTPFDTAEGESEIVSGFNIEYGGGLFALIFISEYGMIIFMSFITSILFLSDHMITMKVLSFCFFYIWARCSFPRIRYDSLMSLSWKSLLPLSLSMVMFSMIYMY